MLMYVSNFDTVRQSATELFMVHSTFQARLPMGSFVPRSSQNWGATDIKFREKISQSLAVPIHRLDFRYVASYGSGN